MYRCHFCRLTVPPRTPLARVALERRPRRYPARPKAHPAPHDNKAGWRDDPGGDGVEIAREVFACPECADRQGAPRV